jgi:hypothetical protein
VWHGRYGGRDFVVLTDTTGAHRIYALTEGTRIRTWDRDRKVIDGTGRVLTMSETALVGNGVKWPRMPSHNAFWFGWHAAHPDTELIAGDAAAR